MGLLLTGNLYISNGQTWNDLPDRRVMKDNHAYGICFSCSTLENVAMWMLYSGERGKSGALIKFPPSVMKEILAMEQIEIGTFNAEGKFEAVGDPFIKSDGDYEIFLTDVVYTDLKKKESDAEQDVILSCGEDHAHAPMQLLSTSDVYYKNYAWSYEKECRLIVKLRKLPEAVQEEDVSHIRIGLSEKARRLLMERVVRSPILESKVDFGKVSELSGKIKW